MGMSDTTRPPDEDGPEDFEGGNDPFEAGESELPASEPGELDLGEEDARLPWLEGEDEEDDYRGGGGQILLLAGLALAALVLIVGGLWWFTREKPDAMVADGGVIKAPAQPYKEKPADPGGKTFQGTGDTSFAVSEGEVRPARLGDEAQAPKPGFEALATKDGKKTASAKAETASPHAETAPAPSGPAVQVGAYSTRELAEAGWNRLASQHAALKGQRYRVTEGRADFGTVYRLQALPGDMAAARKLCGDLKAAGQDCTIKN